MVRSALSGCVGNTSRPWGLPVGVSLTANKRQRRWLLKRVRICCYTRPIGDMRSHKRPPDCQVVFWFLERDGDYSACLWLFFSLGTKVCAAVFTDEVVEHSGSELCEDLRVVVALFAAAAVFSFVLFCVDFGAVWIAETRFYHVFL